jgi:WhiB family redox-sensing transcriptional regulator
MAPTSWRDAAACQSADPDLFFPVSSAGLGAEQVAEAKEICARCLVRRQCLDFSIVTRQAYGVWGGLTEQERSRLRADDRSRPNDLGLTKRTQRS